MQTPPCKTCGAERGGFLKNAPADCLICRKKKALGAAYDPKYDCIRCGCPRALPHSQVPPKPVCALCNTKDRLKNKPKKESTKLPSNKCPSCKVDVSSDRVYCAECWEKRKEVVKPTAPFHHGKEYQGYLQGIYDPWTKTWVDMTAPTFEGYDWRKVERSKG